MICVFHDCVLLISICKYRMLLSFLRKSCFEGLKVGAQISTLRVGLRVLICVGCFGHSNLHFLGPQTAFEGYKFEGTVRDALIAQSPTAR